MPDDAIGCGFTLSDHPSETDDEAFARLAGMDPIAYDRVHKAEAKRLGVKVSTLDLKVSQARGTSDIAIARRVTLPDHEPWDTPVAAGALLDEMAQTITNHVILPQVAADVIALWIAHSWVADRFDHTPRLAITSPTKRCGKSTLLDILKATCRRPLKADNISLPAFSEPSRRGSLSRC